MPRIINIGICLFFLCGAIQGQGRRNIFNSYFVEDLKFKYYNLLLLKNGSRLVSTSYYLCRVTGSGFDFFQLEKNKKYGIKNEINIFPEAPEDTIKTFAESKDGYVFFVTHDNQIVYQDEKTQFCDLPPFYFPPKGETRKNICKIWINNDQDLYIGTTDGYFYIVPKVAGNEALGKGKYMLKGGSDSNIVIVKGEKAVNRITLAPNVRPYSFAQDSLNKNIVWIGTNKGLFNYDKINGKTFNILPDTLLGHRSITITHLAPGNNGDIWFSTLERGMGHYYYKGKDFKFYPYPKKQKSNSSLYPIYEFCVKSFDEFFVAVGDSLPAVFSTVSRTYRFINDSIFAQSKNSTTDIKVDKAGNLFLIKGEILYSCNTFDAAELAGSNPDSISYSPFITGISLLGGAAIASADSHPELLEKVQLKYNQNSILVYFNVNYFSKKKDVQFKWKVDGYRKDWMILPVIVDAGWDSACVAYMEKLQPGKYLLKVQVRIGDGPWSKEEAKLEIAITPPFWKTWWFWAIIILAAGSIIGWFLWWRIKVVKKREEEKFSLKKQLLEMEAMALRSQMNPHFIFNCMNSIKSLIQKDDNDKAVTYLTTFSKLIRSIFQNSDKREISLFDEVETCRLYTQLESMRFGTKLYYSFIIEENIDLKSIMVPALILQPFIENAIWHGIMPKDEGGTMNIKISRKEGKIYCVVEDNGIGRKASAQNKANNFAALHESKGVRVSQSRLELSNTINQRNQAVQIIDMTNDKNEPVGTKVILIFDEY